MAKHKPTASNAKSVSTPELALSKSEFGQALLEILTSGSASYQRIADYLLRNQPRLSAFGVEDLAEACQVSTATVSRFARDMGFTNFAAMRNEVADVLQNAFQPVEKLRTAIASRDEVTSPSSVSLEYAIANTELARQGLAVDSLQQIVGQLTRARTVFVMGFGLSSHLAGMLALYLQPFCPHVVEVVSYGGTEVAAGNLANIGDKDVLIAIAFPRYANDAIRLVNFARDRSACIVTITDSAASPLAAIADFLLLAPSTHPVLPSSSSAAIALIEALVSKLMASNTKNVEKAIKLTEALTTYLYEPAVRGSRSS